MQTPLFHSSECKLFSGSWGEQRKYNDRRKIVADKFSELGEQLQPKLKAEGYELGFRVSRHYPNPRNRWYVEGIWLAFTGRDRYYNYAQLNVGLYGYGLRIGIEIPRSHKDNPVARNLLVNSASYVASSLNKIGERVEVDFWPTQGRDWEVRAPINPITLASAAKKADYETWISMGEWYRPSELSKLPNILSRAITVFRALKPVFRAVTANQPNPLTKVRVIDEFTSKAEVTERAKKFLQTGGFDSTELDVWRKERTVNWPIKNDATVIRSPQTRIIAALDLRPKRMQGEWVQTTPGLTVPKYSQVKRLREMVAKLVKIMGGNPRTVKVMVTDERTDGRILEEQLFVNALLTDKSPAYWGIVAARELAGLTTKSYYPHVRRMSTLLERLISNETFLALARSTAN